MKTILPKISKQFFLTNTLRLISLFVLLTLLYIILIVDLSERYNEKNLQLSTQIKQYEKMQQLAINLPKNFNVSSKNSLLADINLLAKQLELNDNFSRVSINKNQATIAIESTSYQRLIRFLIATSKRNIILQKLKFDQSELGYVRGQIILEK